MSPPPQADTATRASRALPGSASTITRTSPPSSVRPRLKAKAWAASTPWASQTRSIWYRTESRPAGLLRDRMRPAAADPLVVGPSVVKPALGRNGAGGGPDGKGTPEPVSGPAEAPPPSEVSNTTPTIPTARNNRRRHLVECLLITTSLKHVGQKARAVIMILRLPLPSRKEKMASPHWWRRAPGVAGSQSHRRVCGAHRRRRAPFRVEVVCGTGPSTGAGRR
ncbi:MAG: hypothetical protein BWY79_01857 [Actinobacteria bacterium ADurb.Bin444]|nr:MAG: hypothetical protein BWY79_01857 [Actinobacteria bacterium ADurb.Bin444]